MHLVLILRKYSYRLWLGLAGCILIFHHGHAQPGIIRFQRFTDEQGLPNNVFKEVIQDRDGLLWMAGQDGLAVYNGYEVQSFRHSHNDSTTISGNKITTLYEDSKGRLWIGALGLGVNVSNAAKSSFRKVPLPGTAGTPFASSVDDITEDSLHHLWFAVDGCLHILSEGNQRFLPSSYMDTLQQQEEIMGMGNVEILFTDSSGRVWIGTDNGLYSVNPAENKVTGPKHFPGLPQRLIQDIQFDRTGRLWVSCRNEGPRLYYADPGSFSFKAFSKIQFRSPLHNVHFTFDLDNRLWVTEFSTQAFGFDFRDSTLFLESTVNSDISHERFFRRPLVDHSGNVWLPVEGFYIYPYPKGFNTYRHPFAFHQSNSCINAIDQDLWLGYREKGLVRLDKSTGSAVHYSSEGEKGNQIPVDHIQDILKVRSGNYMLVGFANVSFMDPQGKIIASHKINGTLRGGFEDSAGRIWIGGYDGLHLISEKDGVMKTYRQPGPEGDVRQYIQTIVEDAQGNIWFVSDIKGLGKLNPATGDMQQFLPQEGDRHSLPSVSIMDIAVSPDNKLWLATDVALVRFDPLTHVSTSFDRSFGLDNDFITAVICTADGLIWISTHSGISSFDPVSEQFVNYSKSDGLSNVGYYSRSKHIDDQGVLYFGGKNGVDYFHPSQLRNNPTAPRMLLAGVTLNNEKKLSAHDLEENNGELHLTYKDDLLEIEIVGLHYAEQDAVRYSYRMSGVHDDWIDLGKQRKVVFSGLRPGDYSFEARAVSGDDVVSEHSLSLPISITPPFYETAWFRAAVIIMMAGALYFLISYREQSIKKKDRQEAEVNRKIAELEKRALQAQMNPHFIYNSMNSIQQFMIIHDIEGAMKYLTKFSRILRTVLNISAQSRIPLSDEIKLIEDYLELENMRFPNKFTWTIHVSPDINIHSVEIPPFFIQPQVENAIRHGLLKKQTQGHLRIEISSEDHHLHILVEDNGIGREAAMAAKSKGGVINESKGLAIVKERLAHLGSNNGFKPFKVVDLYDNEQRPAGTRVEITLPLD